MHLSSIHNIIQPVSPIRVSLLQHHKSLLYYFIMMSHFKLISSTKAFNVLPVNKYKSDKTGLTVIIADVEGPVVTGYFCLATEANDDDGLPHTLEHLIFLGSNRYPYKGILDLLANRCLAQGTNAWTGTDHTCYTIYTAGDCGMLTLLPIYLDHILNPILSDEGFLTEVHHVDGEGNDAGVVYCEMQGGETNAHSRCELKLLRALYPNSGYSAQTGGIMKNLRESTNNTKVRAFHKKFYRPENLTIILAGQIKADDVFCALQTVETDIIAKREKELLEPWVKPWQSIPPLPNYGEYREQWPADTEDCGHILFGWRGPTLTAPGASRELTACEVVLCYLCDTGAAPLQRCLVEREDARAGDISYILTENIASLIKIELNNVPIDELELARDEATKCLQCVRDGLEPFNMERMTSLLKKRLRECFAGLESYPHDAITGICIKDALFSRNEQDFISRINPQEVLQELLSEGEEYWRGIMKKYFTNELVTIVGSPSIKLQDQMAEEEKNRIEAQRKRLGESGLATKAKILEQAVEFNKRPPPPGTLAAVPVPRCDNLKCHSISTWSAGAKPCPHFDLTQLPMYARVHSLKTNFVYINLILDTTKVDQNTRKWLQLQLNGLAECPVRRGDALIPHEEVISTTEQLTTMFTVDMGIASWFGNYVLICATCEPGDYVKVVDHLYEVLYAAEITKERLLVFAQRLINEGAQARRSGPCMVYELLHDSVYSAVSNVYWSSVLRQQKFLKELIENRNAGGERAETVIKEGRDSYKKMTENVWLHLTTDFERYPLTTEPWKRFPIVSKSPPSLYWDAELLSGWGGGFVVGVGGEDTSFLAARGPGPLGMQLAQAAPLLVALNYFAQMEGPMWRQIRGCGLAYGFCLYAAFSEARIAFSLYSATNAVGAYNNARSIVEEYLTEGKFDNDLFASAKSSALFEVVVKETCTANVVTQSLLNYFKQVSENYNRDLMCAIAAVTPEAAHAAAARWLPSLFDVAQGKISVVCHPSKVRELQAAFDKINVKLDAFESLEASHLNK